MGFGRFGSGETPSIPGFQLTERGFRAKSGSADWFTFKRPLKLRLQHVSPEEGVYTTGRYVGNPQTIKVSLRGSGFEMVAPLGIEFGVASTVPPKLTTREATYGSGVPSGKCGWALVTFSDPQPPVLLAFEDKPTSLVVDGKPGEWRVHSTDLGMVRLRACLPFGVRPVAANSVGAYGELAKGVSAGEGFWAAPSPRLVSKSATETDAGVEVVWTFDREGAMVPPAYVLAKLAGHKVRCATPLWDTGESTDEGPIVLCRGKSLSVTFPVVAARSGRFVCLGSPPASPSGSPPLPIESLLSLSWCNLLAGRSAEAASQARAALEEGLSRLESQKAPGGVRAPYDPARGPDARLAATGLLQAVLAHAEDAPVGSSLLESFALALDPLSWRLPSSDRTAALLGSAGLRLSPSADDLALAAMLEMGVRAESERAIYLRRKGIPAEGDAPAVKAFGPMPFGQEPLTLLTDQALTAEQVGNRLRVTWRGSAGKWGELRFSTARWFAVKPLANLEALVASAVSGEVFVRYKAQREGECTAELTWPKSPPVLPQSPASWPDWLQG